MRALSEVMHAVCSSVQPRIAETQDGRLFLRHDNHLTVVDVETGAVRWRYGE